MPVGSLQAGRQNCFHQCVQANELLTVFLQTSDLNEVTLVSFSLSFGIHHSIPEMKKQVLSFW